MALKKLVIKLKTKQGERGTQAAEALIELFNENWDQLQEKFKAQSEEEQNDMLQHFNAAADSLGDALFGNESNRDELGTLITGLTDEQQNDVDTAVKEALEFEDP